MELINNQYVIDGVPVLDICKEFGTPLYVYNSKTIERQYNRLKNAFNEVNIKISYACKALTNISVLKFLKSLGSGIDTVSIQEVELGLKAGFDPQDIIYTPNGVSIDEIKKAVQYGVVVNIDNISILEQFGFLYGNSYPVCIRLNPHIMAGGNSKISVGHIDSKFGISIYQMRHLQRVIKSNNIKVTGLHMHTGSDILDVDVFIEGAGILLESALEFKDLEFLDFGSGFKVKYSPEDNETDVEALGVKLGERIKEFQPFL